MQRGHVLAKYLSCCAASQSAETHICSRKVAKAGAAACPQCGGAGGGSDWAEAFATALCEIFECPPSVHRKVIDLVTSAVAFEPRAEDPDSERSQGESPSRSSESEDAVSRSCHDEKPTADVDSRRGAAGILELAPTARGGSGPVDAAAIGDTGDGDERDECLGSSWGSVSSVQDDEAPAEDFEGFSRRRGGTGAGRRGGACGRIGVVDFEDDEEDDETVLRGVWYPRPDVAAPSSDANAAGRTGSADRKGVAGHESPADCVTPRASPSPRRPPLQAAPRGERHEATPAPAAHPGGRTRGWRDPGSGYHATASLSNGRDGRNVQGDQPRLWPGDGENRDDRHGGLRATASKVYLGEGGGVRRSSSLGGPHVAGAEEGNERRLTLPPALDRSRSENRRPRVAVRDDAGDAREGVNSVFASRSTWNTVDFPGDAPGSRNDDTSDRFGFGGGRNSGDVGSPHAQDLLVAQDSFSGEDDEGSEVGYEEFVVLVSREATVKELAAKVADFPTEWLGEAFGTVIRRQVEGGTYDARARAAMKRAVRLLGGRISWKQQIAATERELARLAQHREALIQDGDQNKEAPVTGRYWKVGLAAAGGGVLLFLSGGVAAPSVTASLSAVGFAAANSVSSVAPSLGAWLGYTSAAAAASAAVSGTAGAIGAGAAGAGVAGYKMTRRTAGVQEFHFLPLHSKWPLDSPESMFEGDSEPGLPVFICIPGWHEPGHDPRHTWGGIGYGSPTNASGAETGDSSLPKAWPVEAEDEEDGELVGDRSAGAHHQVTAAGIPTAEVEPPSRSVSTAQAVTSTSRTPTNARCARVSVRLPSPARSPDDGFSTPAIPIPMAHATAVQRGTVRGRTLPRTVSAVPTSVVGPGISCQPPRAELAVLHRPGAVECRVSPTRVVHGRVPHCENSRVAQPESIACGSRHPETVPGVANSSFIDLSGPSHVYLSGRSCGALGFEEVEMVTPRRVRTDREIQYPGEGGSRATGEGEEAAGRGVEGGMDGSWEALPSHAWWRDFVPGGEEHVLVWERGPLTELHSAMRDLAWKSATRRAVNEVLKRSALAPVVAAAAWPLALLDAASGLDDPWGVVRSRALEAGRLLAAVLLSRPVGSRPVTLLGYSMGAKVVFNCLEALAAAPGDRGLGIVENAVMLGTPVGTKRARWKRARSAVAGRLVNGFSSRDWLLALIYRSKSWSVGIAGTARVEGCGVENIDLSGLIVWHLNYPRILPTVMAMLRLED